METYLRIIGQNIRSTRLRKNISQEALASMAGLDRSHIGYIERGEKDIRISTLIKISSALDIAPGSLLEASVLPPSIAYLFSMIELLGGTSVL